MRHWVGLLSLVGVLLPLDALAQTSLSARAVDQHDLPVAAQVFFARDGLGVQPSTWLDAPQSLSLPGPVGVLVYARFGGLQASQTVTLAPEHTTLWEVRTGNVSFTPTPGQTSLRVLFEVVDAVVATVDQARNPVAGQLYFAEPSTGAPPGLPLNQWVASPVTVRMASGGALYAYTRHAGLWRGPSLFNVKAAHITAWDVRTDTVVIEEPSVATTTHVHAIFEMVDVQVATVDQQRNAVGGQFAFYEPSTGAPAGLPLNQWVPSPVTVRMASGGSGLLDGFGWRAAGAESLRGPVEWLV